MRPRTLQVLACAGFIVWSSVRAAPGDVDPTFVYPRPAVLEPDSTNALPLADGFLVVQSRNFDRPGTDSTLDLTRIDEDGHLVGAFGVAGKATTRLAGATNLSTAAKLLPSGSLLLAGFQRTPGTEPDSFAALARFDSAGRQDPTFGLSGMVTVDVPGQLDRVGAVEVLADGRILAGVWSRMAKDPYGDCSTDRVSLVRLEPDGTAPEVIYYREKNAFADNGCRNVMTLEVASNQSIFFGSHVEIAVFDSPLANDTRVIRSPIGCCYGPFAVDPQLGAVWTDLFFGGAVLNSTSFPYGFPDSMHDSASRLMSIVDGMGFPPRRTVSRIVRAGDPPHWYLGFSSDSGTVGVIKLRSDGSPDSGWAGGKGVVRIDGTGGRDDYADEGLATDVRLLSLRRGGEALVVVTADGVIERRFAQSATAHGQISFSLGWLSVSEATGVAKVAVLRRGGVDGAVSVDYNFAIATDCVVDACAQQGIDFGDVSGRLDWADGDDSARFISIPIRNDSLRESGELLSIEIRAPSGGAAIVEPSSVVLTILDDDDSASGNASGGGPGGGGSGGGGAVSWLSLVLIGACVLLRRRIDCRPSLPGLAAVLATTLLGSGTHVAHAGIGDMDTGYGDGGQFRARDHGSNFVFSTLIDGRLVYPVPGGYRLTDVSGRPENVSGADGIRAWPEDCDPQSWLKLRDGRLVAAGRSAAGLQNQFSLCRFQADGRPDAQFGRGGVSSIDGPASGPDLGYWTVVNLDEHPDGRLLMMVAHAADIWDDTYDRYTLIRLLQDGTRDRTFGADGSVEMSARTGSDFVVLADGRIRIGSFFLDERGDWASGAPIASALPESTTHNWAVAARLPGGGEILMAEGDPAGATSPYKLAKRRADGSVDVSFGEDGSGVATLSFGEHGLHSLRVVSVSADGRHLYLLGYGGDEGGATVARLLANGPDAGKPDRSFGVDGLVNFQGSGYYFQGIQGLADGSAIVHGVDYAFRMLGNDTASPGFVAFRGYVCCANESAGRVVLTVFRAAGKDGELHVRYATESVVDDSGSIRYATQGVDYEAVSGELVWEDGDDSDKFIAIPILPDTITEGTEQIRVALSSPSAGSWILGYSSVNAAISDPPPSQGAPPAPPAPVPPQASGNSGGGGYGGLTILCLLGAMRRLVAKARIAR